MMIIINCPISLTILWIPYGKLFREENSCYEYGSCLASDCVLKAMDEIEPGKLDIESPAIYSYLVSQDYLESVAIPYYAAVVAWLENVKIGMSGSEMYDCTQAALPKEQFN